MTRLELALWRDHEIIPGRASGVVHVVVPNEAMPAAAARRG